MSNNSSSSRNNRGTGSWKVHFITLLCEERAIQLRWGARRNQNRWPYIQRRTCGIVFWYIYTTRRLLGQRRRFTCAIDRSNVCVGWFLVRISKNVSHFSIFVDRPLSRVDLPAIAIFTFLWTSLRFFNPLTFTVCLCVCGLWYCVSCAGKRYK